MARLSVLLLGPFEVSLGDQLVTDSFRTEKERALLAYLIEESSRGHARRSVAELLWPERPEGIARTSLRQALSGVRRAIGDRGTDEVYIQVSNGNIQFNTNSDYWSDTSTFTALIRSTQAHKHANLDTCDVCIQALKDAVALFRGDFLEDLGLPDGVEFQEWVMFNREAYFRQLLIALQALIVHFRNRGDYEQAYKYAWKHVHMAPLEENAHRQVMELLALTGRRSAALEQYQACRHILAVELGVEPAEETKLLFEKIKSGQMLTPAQNEIPTKPVSLPVTFTNFVGREMELEWFANCIPSSVCRFITVVGMAGIGKTRLAIQTATILGNNFPDGVFFVPLDAIHSMDELVLALKKALGLHRYSQQDDRADPKEQIVNYLMPLKALLIFDGFENMLANTWFLLEILRYAPGVKIIVTSRQRLNYQAACLLELGPLPFPQKDQIDRAQEFPAVQLFLDRAKRSRFGFSISDANRLDILRICETVGGLPLAIELAADLLHKFTVNQIAGELAGNINLLNSGLEDLPERQRTLCSAFEQSWGKLSTSERALLRRLAVFSSSFSLEAVQAIAAPASPDDLSSLHDQSLLLRDAPNRFHLQPVFRFFAADKLAAVPDEADQVEARHSQYFLNFLKTETAQMRKGQRLKYHLDQIQTEVDNIQAALEWSIRNRQEHVAERSADLHWFYEQCAVLLEEQKRLEASAQTAGQAEDLGRLSLSEEIETGGWCCDRVGRLEDANRAMILTDESGAILDVNYQAYQLTGFTREALLSMNFSDLLSNGCEYLQFPTDAAHACQLLTRDETSIPITVNRVDISESQRGHSLYIFYQNREDPCCSPTRELLVARDPLTGLPNRELFTLRLRDCLAAAAKSGIQIGVVLIDLHNLKSINARLGPHQGDLILQMTAERLKALIRESDLLARIGNDEFAVLLKNPSGKKAIQRIAVRFSNELAVPFYSRDQSITMNPNLGISLYPEDGDSAELLIRHADHALRRLDETDNYSDLQMALKDTGQIQ